MSEISANKRELANFVPLVLGCLLLLAATLKIEQFALETYSSDSFITSKFFFTILIECELLLGIWLLSRIYERQARIVAIGFFSVFSIAATVNGLQGESSCGCFGRVSISPWWTLALDLLAVIALFKWKPIAILTHQIPSHRSNLKSCILLAIIVIGTSFTMLVSSKPSQVNEDGVIQGESELVILEPEEWTGQTLPIYKHIDIGSQLLTGDWSLVLYHHDCIKCKEMIPKYHYLANDVPADNTGRKIALVETPPYKDKVEVIKNTRTLINGRLSNKYDWFIQTPVEITLENGKVTSASTELPRLKEINLNLSQLKNK